MFMQDEDGDTTLIEVCQDGHVEIARVLLDLGANVNYRNRVKSTSQYSTLTATIIHARLILHYRMANQLFGGQALLVRQSV